MRPMLITAAYTESKKLPLFPAGVLESAAARSAHANAFTRVSLTYQIKDPIRGLATAPAASIELRAVARSSIEAVRLERRGQER